jgi:hypothetical protein
MRMPFWGLQPVRLREGRMVSKPLFWHPAFNSKCLIPPAGVRQSMVRARYAAEVEIAGMGDVLSLLGWGPEELWNDSRRAA